jgi:type II secretory pathway pseudopilin PulG
VELIVALTIVVVLAVALNASFQGWMGRYNVESEIRQLYGDMIQARAMAMQRKRSFFLIFPSTTQYSLYEDTNTAPDGNGTLETASDTVLGGFPKTVSYGLTWTTGGTIPYDGTASGRIMFDDRGLVTFPAGADKIIVNTTRIADYDCILVSQTRISLGKATGGACVVK